MRPMNRFTVLLILITLMAPLTSFSKEPKAKMKIDKQAFGKTADGAAVDLYTLTNTHGVEAKSMTYGGVVTSLKMPDKQGKLADVVLGYETARQIVAKNRSSVRMMAEELLVVESLDADGIRAVLASASTAA